MCNQGSSCCWWIIIAIIILFLLLSLMAWIAGKVLRSLFPDKFKGKAGKA